ncbi:hypothetical protein [Mycoplasma sp. P36-A1]|uniref:hypothetical protein n=1 Tax=Mycoplasma sp. P36-A1 TaxID=3252900 RepID=UPI003C2C43F6
MKKIIVLLTVLTNLLIMSNSKASEIHSFGQREVDYSSQEKDQDFERYFFSNLAEGKSFIESACDNSNRVNVIKNSSGNKVTNVGMFNNTGVAWLNNTIYYNYNNNSIQVYRTYNGQTSNNTLSKDLIDLNKNNKLKKLILWK